VIDPDPGQRDRDEHRGRKHERAAEHDDVADHEPEAPDCFHTVGPQAEGQERAEDQRQRRPEDAYPRAVLEDEAQAVGGHPSLGPAAGLHPSVDPP
jgi:hypothetical protein